MANELDMMMLGQEVRDIRYRIDSSRMTVEAALDGNRLSIRSARMSAISKQPQKDILVIEKTASDQIQLGLDKPRNSGLLDKTGNSHQKTHRSRAQGERGR